MGRGPRAEEPGRHRHAADRRRGGDRDARLGHPQHVPFGRGARRPPGHRHRRGAGDHRTRARAIAGGAGVGGDARGDDAARARGDRRLPPERADRPVALAGGARPLGRARLRAPPLRLLLAAHRGVRRALQPLLPRADDGRQVLREDLRRGYRRPARRRHSRPAHRPLLPDLSDGLRPQLPRARVLRRARAGARRAGGDARADASQPARFGVPAGGPHGGPRRRLPVAELPDGHHRDLGLGDAGHRLLGLPAVSRLAAARVLGARALGQASLPRPRTACGSCIPKPTSSSG